MSPAAKTLPLTDLLLAPDNHDDTSIAGEPQTEPRARSLAPLADSMALPVSAPPPVAVSTPPPVAVSSSVPNPNPTQAPTSIGDEPPSSAAIDAPDASETPRLPRLDVSMAISPLTRELLRKPMFNRPQSRGHRRAAETRARRNR